ncbi:pr1-like protein [Oryza sativa Japonica Group]|uniref:Pr1-like protein n=1 Tax=Oryza sativa subsp. japonica TaxID=39947 RepID=Q8GSW8_ORYSJ|nr:pr1-like protein [Oryza sativa Japonica Group]
MVAGGGHRHGGAAAERGEGKREKKRRSTAHPGSTATTETATGAEEGGGAARVDGVDGAPAVGERNGGVDEVAGDAVKPKVAMPRREVVRGDDGGGPELGGERERATARARFRRGERAASGGNGGGRHGEGLYRIGRGRELPDEGETGAEDPVAIDGAGEVKGEVSKRIRGREGGKNGGKEGGNHGEYFPPLYCARGRREAAGFAAAAALGHGRGGGSGGRKGMTGGPHPSARVSGGPARQRHERGEEAEWAAGERRERERDGPSRPKRGRGEKGLFRA